MAETREDEIRQLVDRVYRAESSRILATLIRLLGEFDLAEEAMQDAFAAALVRCSRDGAPENPRAWLVSTARFEAIDSLRRRARFDASLERIAEQLETQTSGVTVSDNESVEDDQLRLIFTCCHPALAPEARLAFNAAGGVWFDHGGDCACFSNCRLDACSTRGARKGRDPRSTHSF